MLFVWLVFLVCFVLFFFGVFFAAAVQEGGKFQPNALIKAANQLEVLVLMKTNRQKNNRKNLLLLLSLKIPSRVLTEYL